MTNCKSLMGNGRGWMGPILRPLIGRKGQRPYPIGRRKLEVKRSLLTEGQGIPFGLGDRRHPRASHEVGGTRPGLPAHYAAHPHDGRPPTLVPRPRA